MKSNYMVTKSTQSKEKKVPKLRFEGFEGEWEERGLGEVAEFFKGKGISKDDIDKNGKNKCVRYGELYTEYDEVIKDIKSKTNVELDDSFLSQENDVLMPTSDVTPNGLATGSALSEKGIILGGDILVIRSGHILNTFFSYYISAHKKDIMRLVSGATVYHIYGSDLKKMKVNIPSLKEQKRIASFLSSMDTWVENLLVQKKELNKYKKGLMRKVFSQELRFEGFDEVWEEKRLGEVFNINAGGDINPKNVSDTKDDVFKYPIYANSDKNKGLYGYADIYKIDQDCITVTGRGNIGISVARFEKFYPIVRLLVLKLKNPGCIRFFEYALNNKRFFIESTGVPQLTGPQISTYKIKFPLPKEQEKISIFLSSIDTLIELKQKQINYIENYKKSLIQNLFI